MGIVVGMFGQQLFITFRHLIPPTHPGACVSHRGGGRILITSVLVNLSCVGGYALLNDMDSSHEVDTCPLLVRLCFLDIASLIPAFMKGVDIYPALMGVFGDRYEGFSYMHHLYKI
jgi:hypothetical protein